jgi:polysaccharide export outer membrane protein
LAALLALCLAAGCQSPTLRCPNCGSAIQQTTAVTLGLPRLTVASSLRCAAPGPATTVALKPGESSLTPVAASDADNTSIIASSWRPVERIAAPDGQAAPAGPTITQTSAPAEPPYPPATTAQLAPDSGGLVRADLTTPPGPPPPIATTRAPAPADVPAGLHLPAVVAPAPPPVAAAPVVHYPAHAYNIPREGYKQALPPYVVEPPDVLLIRASKAVTGDKAGQQPIDGPHLVRPDGTVDLGIYGSVFVAGMTLNDIRDMISRFMVGKVTGSNLKAEEIRLELYVDVIAYNSKFYYVITNNADYGEIIVRRPITGNETVLDALASIQGLPDVASKKKIWLARPTPDHTHLAVLPIDYRGITRCGPNGSNYQLYPGDRIYVDSDPLLRLDSRLAKFFSPIERILGVTLLGSSTVNSITNRTGGGGGTGR